MVSKIFDTSAAPSICFSNSHSCCFSCHRCGISLRKSRVYTRGEGRGLGLNRMHRKASNLIESYFISLFRWSYDLLMTVLSEICRCQTSRCLVASRLTGETFELLCLQRRVQRLNVQIKLMRVRLSHLINLSQWTPPNVANKSLSELLNSISRLQLQNLVNGRF